MDKETLFAELKEMLISISGDPDIDYSSIKGDSLIFENLGLNSIGMMYISLSIEENYGVPITNEAISSIKTVDDLLNYIIDNKKD